MFETKVVQEIKTHILCSVMFFENRTFYEIMWKNIVEPERPRMTIWRMCIACWIIKFTYALAICNLLLLHYNNGCKNAPQCYTYTHTHIYICSLLVLFVMKLRFVHLVVVCFY